jgi:hypothetical protein
MCGMPFDFPCAAFAASIPAVSLLNYLTVLQYAFLKSSDLVLPVTMAVKRGTLRSAKAESK